MAVLAEPALDLIDDRLAARNAVILGVAQALAGGNNTVIVATTSVIDVSQPSARMPPKSLKQKITKPAISTIEV